MSRYLEEAAAVLEQATEHANENLFGKERNDRLRSIAHEYGLLAAIDKGLLPTDLTGDLIDNILRTRT